MDDTIITNNGEVILILVGKEKTKGFYALVTDVTADLVKRNFWVVKFALLVPMKDWKLREVSWLLDDQQIRGEEFTMNGVPHQLFKIDILKKIEEINYKNKVIDHKDKNAEHPNDLSNLELKDADSAVPLPRPRFPFSSIGCIEAKTQKADLNLVVDNPNPILDPTKTYEKPNLTLVK